MVYLLIIGLPLSQFQDVPSLIKLPVKKKQSHSFVASKFKTSPGWYHDNFW